MSYVDTQIASLKEIRDSGKRFTQQQRILLVLLQNPKGLIRDELAEITKLRLSSVCGRVNELLEAGTIELGPKCYNRHTDRFVYSVRPVIPEEQTGQLDLPFNG